VRTHFLEALSLGLLCRDVQQLCTDAYLADWFEYSTGGGLSRFALPSVWPLDLMTDRTSPRVPTPNPW
jgi:hypothetical protein